MFFCLGFAVQIKNTDLFMFILHLLFSIPDINDELQAIIYIVTMFGVTTINVAKLFSYWF